ncbi:MAG TPA: hypothetical protein VFR55_03345 [Dehalococcoidia bacterium]|nr:hypothetical protein [Dehalococcoidia bacterium]
MPGKGRRVASRQAELGKRRRRQGRVAGSVVTGGSEAGVATPAQSSVANGVRESPAVARKAESLAQPRPTSPQPHRGPARARLDRPAAYNYVIPELRRVLILSGALLVILIGISIAMSYLI